MLVGQSIFQSVLDRLDAEAPQAVPEPAAYRIQGLNAGFAADIRDGNSATAARPGDAYFENLGASPSFAVPSPEVTAEVGPPPARESPPSLPAHLEDITPEAVAAELAISGKDSQQVLVDKRRSFAKSNHPDAVDPLFRDRATARMKIANLLIDEAMRRLAIEARLATRHRGRAAAPPARPKAT